MAISLVENAKKKEGFIDFAPYFNKIKHKLIWCLVVVVAGSVVVEAVAEDILPTALLLEQVDTQ